MLRPDEALQGSLSSALVVAFGNTEYLDLLALAFSSPEPMVQLFRPLMVVPVAFV